MLGEWSGLNSPLRALPRSFASLLSTTTRLLRRCTPWKIGDAMGDILATINLGY